VAAFVQRTIYIITATKGLFMANLLMPCALVLTLAPVSNCAIVAGAVRAFGPGGGEGFADGPRHRN